MGVVRVRVVVANPINGRSVEAHAIVDTGASYTVIPEAMDRELGTLPRSGRVVRVEKAGGGDVLEEAMALIELEGERGFTPVLISRTQDEVLIGLLTLEGFGFRVGPVTGRLVGVPIYLLRS